MPPMAQRIRRFLGRRRSSFATVLELVGFGLVVKAAWDVAHPLGFVTAGGVLLAVALVLEARRQ